MKTPLTILLLLAAVLRVPAADVQSVSRLAFGPDGVLFVADWKASAIHALVLPPASAPAGGHFNIRDLDRRLARALGEAPAAIIDLAMRPGTGDAYVAVVTGAAQRPALVRLGADGRAERLDLAATKSTSLPLKDAPKGDLKFWDETPLRSLTVTDMKWHGGKLYVAGLANTDFSSTLRVAAYPFTGGQSVTAVAIYHATHDQTETRAPIRAMTFVTLGGEPHLIAAYTCTPLVTFPVAAIKDGAKLTGKTIAELGFGNTPNGLLAYTAEVNGQPMEFVLVANAMRSSDAVPLTELEAANARAGLKEMVPFGEIRGVRSTPLPLAGVFRIDNQDAGRFVALRRNPETGASELVSIGKGLYLRRSDFVAEYNFPGYSYKANGPVQTGFLLPLHERLNREEGFPPPVSN
ncbi:MAG: hypothetical protein Q8N18_21110 [Opitutaceae bacterium]|nr:hypothetical protein [Opitutaceae bacterium]